MTDAWSLQGRNSARDGRHTMAAYLGALPAAPFTTRPGVLPSTTTDGRVSDLRVITAPTPDRAVQVLPGHAVITRPGEGPYLCWSAATLTVPADPADPTNPRTDLVVARLWDPAIGDPAAPLGPVAEVITGRASPTPAPPETPGNAIVLAELTRPAGVDAIDTTRITDRRRSAVLRGAVRVLLPGDDPGEAGAHPGAYRHRNGLEYFDGTLWRGILAPPPITTTVAERRGHTEAEILVANLTVPDPGWPYVIVATGAAEVIASDQEGEGVPAGRADLTLRLDSSAGPVIGVGVGPDTAAVRGAGGTARRLVRQTITHPGRSAVLTGSHAVLLLVTRAFGDANFRIGSAGFNGSLIVQAVPA